MDASSIPNRFDFAETQSRIYREWETRGFFHAEPPAEGQPDATQGPYCIVIPPPNVTGALHLGHALNNTLQDIQIRMHRMQGYNTLWMPGTDHAGIATQAVVEKRLREEEGKTRHDLGREGLVARIWEWKEVYEKRILDQLKQMGCSCDWARTRFTFDEGCSRAVRQTFFSLFSQGLIYRGKRLVNWDTFLQTAVSDDEVFHETVKGHFWHFRYPIIQARSASEGNAASTVGEPTFVEIATTRPETMLGDTAVAVHPDPAGALDKAEVELRERLDKAPAKEKDGIQAQIDNVQKRRTEMLPLLLKLRDMAAAGRKVMLPLVNREIPLICDEWAKPELGTGAVKITPAHDPNDYAVWQRHQEIGLVNILNPDGTLNASAGPYKGLTIYKARDKVVADLDALSLLGEVEDREIDLAHSDRSKTPIEPYLADQWFVKMSDTQARSASEGSAASTASEGVAVGRASEPRPGLAQMAMDAVSSGRVNVVPPRYAKSYLDWLSEKRDWPVSRQLWWGHRIPVWTLTLNKQFAEKWFNPRWGKGFKDPMPPAVAQLERVFSNEGVEDCADHIAIEQVDENTLQICAGSDEADRILARLSKEIALRKSGGVMVSKWELAATYFDNAERDPDVLDTWFSSALWPHSTLGWPEQTRALDYWYPTSVLITSRDIITLWVARMVLTGLNNMGEVPFREVFIHPKILDGYGETMSKMKGNGVDPVDVISKFGADSLRFGLASMTTETQDVRMPVQYECPHCSALIDQTKQNRSAPRVKCTKCSQEFSTQWARTDADLALPRAAVVSERFEVARNFMNKLWNASRFVLINLAEKGTGDEGQGTGGASILTRSVSEGLGELTTEDRWLLSRLATVTKGVTEALQGYHYADAAKLLYDFAWDEFCSFYVEIAKARLADEQSKGTAQRVLAHALDTLLRLLHPMMPFLTEEVWQLLNKVAPERHVGWDQRAQLAPAHQHSTQTATTGRGYEWLIKAPWPVADLSWQNPEIEARFAVFQQALGAIREIRSRQNIATREPLEFCVKCDEATADLLRPMAPYFQSMTNATATGFGADVTIPPTHAKTALTGLEIFVDLAGFIDVKAELAKNEKEEQRLLGQIKAKEGKLNNESFVSRAPASVVQAERDGLAQFQEQLTSVRAALAALRKSS
jgi:valyl-tRNA synthetase